MALSILLMAANLFTVALVSASPSIQSLSPNAKIPSLDGDSIFNNAMVLTQADTPNPDDLSKALHRKRRNASGPQVTRLHIKTNVRNRFARTSVISTVENDDANPTEVNFQFMVPDKAFISGFSMEINGEVYKSLVMPKDQAKKEYTKAVDKGKSAAHLRPIARDSSLFNVSVSLEPLATITFKLKYEELLVRKSDLYDVIIHLVTCDTVILDMSAEVYIKELQKITTVFIPEPEIKYENGTMKERSVKIDKRSEKNVHITYNPTKEQQQDILLSVQNEGVIDGNLREESSSQRLRVQYDVEHTSEDIELQNGYFVHFFGLNKTDTPLLRKHVIFVLDVSGSMSGLKIEQLKSAMTTILDTLKNNDDFFTIITFSTGNRVYPGTSNSNQRIHQVMPESINTVKQYVNNLRADGGTNIKSALNLALEITAEGKNDNNLYMNPSLSAPEQIIIFLTDGMPNEGERNTTVILEDIRLQNLKTKAPIFSLGFGDDADMVFLKKLSLQNYAFDKKIYKAADSDLQLEKFFQRVDTPLIKDLKFQYTNPNVDQSSVTKSKFHTFYAGSEIVILGKLRKKVASVKDLGAHVTHSNKSSTLPSSSNQLQSTTGPPRRVTRDTNEYEESSLNRLWALVTIQQNLDDIIASENTNDGSGTATNETDKTEPMLQKAVNLAMKYGFVTPVTPLIIEKPPSEANSNSATVFEPISEGMPEIHFPPNFTLKEDTSDVDYFDASSASFPNVPSSGMNLLAAVIALLVFSISVKL